MTIKDVWDKTGSWLRAHKPSKPTAYQPEIDDEGLISEGAESTEAAAEGETTGGNQVLVKTVQPMDKTQSLEKLQAGFDKLVEHANLTEGITFRNRNQDRLIKTTCHQFDSSRINKSPDPFKIIGMTRLLPSPEDSGLMQRNVQAFREGGVEGRGSGHQCDQGSQ